jgi:hypothetical protein
VTKNAENEELNFISYNFTWDMLFLYYTSFNDIDTENSISLSDGQVVVYSTDSFEDTVGIFSGPFSGHGIPFEIMEEDFYRWVEIAGKIYNE